MYRQYTTYIKTRCNNTIRLYLATCFGRTVQILLLYLNIVLSWPEDGRLRPKHVAKYSLIVLLHFVLMYVMY